MPVCVDNIKFYDNMKKKQINFHKNHTFFALNFAKMSPIPPLVKRGEPVLHIYPRLKFRLYEEGCVTRRVATREELFPHIYTHTHNHFSKSEVFFVVSLRLKFLRPLSE